MASYLLALDFDNTIINHSAKYMIGLQPLFPNEEVNMTQNWIEIQLQLIIFFRFPTKGGRKLALHAFLAL